MTSQGFISISVFFILATVTNPSASGALLDPYKSSVQQICSITDKPFTRDKGISDLKAAACTIDQRFPLDLGVHEGVTKITQALENLEKQNAGPAAQANVDTDPVLTGALGNLVKKVHENKVIDYSILPAAKGSLASALKKHFEKYKLDSARRADPDGFVQSMMAVLAQTKEGKGLKECFEKKDSPQIAKSVFVFKPPETSAGESGTVECSFSVRPTDEDATAFNKVILLDVSSNPAILIAMFAHELKHSCETPMYLDQQVQALDLEKRGKAIKTDYERLRTLLSYTGNLMPQARQDELAVVITEAKQNQIDMNELGERVDISHSIDELKAYRLTYKIFKELAVNAPKTFCDDYAVTGLFYKKVISTGDYMAALQESDQSGRFANILIDQYSDATGYRWESFYDIDPVTHDFKKDPATGLPLIKPAVRAKMKAAGFNVNP